MSGNLIETCSRSLDSATTINENFISGYACRFNQIIEFAPNCFEVVLPGSFDECLDQIRSKKQKCLAVLEHDNKTILGSTDTANPVILSVDNIGLKYDIPFDPTDPDHLRVAAKIKRGDIKGSSYRYDIYKDGGYKIKNINGRNVRVISKIAKLKDVCPTYNPADKGTEVCFRSSEMAERQEETKRILELVSHIPTS